jgi:type I restriction enzyme S subunit
MSSRAPIGHLGIAGVELCTNQGCKSFIPGPDIDGLYLYFLLQERMQGIRALGSGSTFAEVSKSDLERFKVTIPPIEQQRAIAARLNAQVDVIGRLSAQASMEAAALDALDSRLLAAAFMDIVPLSVAETRSTAPPPWTWRLLTDLARLETGHTPSRNHPEWWGGDIGWVQLADIRAVDGQTIDHTSETTNAEGIAHSAARVLPTGTVVMSRTASVGFVARMGRPMATSQDFVNWVCGPELKPEFLMLLLLRSRGYIRSLASGAVHRTVYYPTVKAFWVCVPPMDTQERVVARIKDLFGLSGRGRTAVGASEQAIEALKPSMLRYATTHSV